MAAMTQGVGGREELGLFCFYQVLILPTKWCSAIGKWIWMSYKRILQTHRGVQPFGVSGPHWKKSCIGPHSNYTNTNKN